MRRETTGARGSERRGRGGGEGCVWDEGGIFAAGHNLEVRDAERPHWIGVTESSRLLGGLPSGYFRGGLG